MFPLYGFVICSRHVSQNTAFCVSWYVVKVGKANVSICYTYDTHWLNLGPATSNKWWSVEKFFL